MKKILFTLVAILLVQISTQAQKTAVFTKNGKAIDGYDAVAFFTNKAPIKGEDAFMFTWNNVSWLFANQQNLDSFKTNPEKYAPQYGGYCAYGCSNGYKAPTQIDTWTIVDDKLYFNYNQKVKESWIKNKEALIIKANENWKKIKM
jgi:YHS domain-containing protein